MVVVGARVPISVFLPSAPFFVTCARVGVVMVMVMMVSSLVVLTPRGISRHIGYDQFRTVPHTFVADSVMGVPVGDRIVQRLPTLERRVVQGFESSFGASRFVQVLPGLSVVTVEPVPGLGAGRVERSHRVAVW